MVDSISSNGLQSALYSGVQGYNRGQQMVNDASANLAQSNRQNIDLNSSVIQMTVGQLQAEASVEVIQRTQGMIGTIIDTYA
ncbi:hypothetical protein [Glaciecola sp. 1036]|uniref:hypothetical protein n=1 Tax=Alteromonadaceae TaxID=72275 RepID=UPI003D057616